MCNTDEATCLTSIVASERFVPSGCGMPVTMALAMSVSAFPMSICEAQISYGRPSSERLFVRPVIACLVLVYGVDPGRGTCAEIEPLLMIRPPCGDW